MKRRLLITGAGTTATSNLIRSLRADARCPTIIGCHGDRFVLKKSEAERNYLMPGLGHPGFFRALSRVIKKERIDLLIPTADAEPGTIVEEMQAGYMLKDRLLRPALVGVAKKPD